MTPGRNRGALAYILIAVMLVVSVFVIMPMLSKSGKSTKYSEIIAYFDDYQVTSYTLDLGTGELEFTVKDSKDKKKYTVPNVSLFLDDTDNYRQEYNKQNPDAPLEQDYYKIKDSSWLLTVIPTVVMLGMPLLPTTWKPPIRYTRSASFSVVWQPVLPGLVPRATTATFPAARCRRS